jgi:hypothetical protein
MKRTLLYLLFVITPVFCVAQNPQGFFLDDWQPMTAPTLSYTTTAQTTLSPTVFITVDVNNKITKVSKYVFGNNAIPWAGKLNTRATLMKDIKNLNPHILRWPGGNLSNEYFWDASETNAPTDIPPTLKINTLNAGKNNSNWAMTLDNYYDMLTKANSTGCICVNYSYARYGTSANPVTNAAHYAANWVRYDKGRTKYWEIGNENMGSWESGYSIDVTLNKDNQPKIITGQLYGQHCRVFIDSMKSAAAEIGSDIKIGVGLVEENITYDTVMQNWNKGVIPEIADKADFLIVHSYYTPYNENSTIQTILNSAAETKGYKDYVLADLKKYGGKDNLPVALTEWNIFAVGSKQQVSYINGMHAALNLGELIRNQYGESTRWDLVNGWADGNDHGLFAGSGEPGLAEGSPHAPFYYMYYFQKYFGDYMVSSKVTGNYNVLTYASTFSSGQCGLVIFNKSTTSQVASLVINNFSNAKSYYRYVLTGGTDNGNFSRKVYINGQGPSGEAGGPSNYETIKAMATPIDGTIKLELPPLSVSYILVSDETITDAPKIKSPNESSIKIYPNPANGRISIFSPDFGFDKIVVTNLNGKNLFEQNVESPIKSNLDINLDLPSGIYILNLIGRNERISRKLVVTRNHSSN